jgi:hypothetical protein
MTDLNMLYGSFNSDLGSDMDYKPRNDDNKRKELSNAYSNMVREESSRISGQQIHQIASQAPQMPEQQLPVHQVQQPVQQMPPQIQMAPQQQYQEPKRRMPQQQYDYSFWDRMSLKRPEVVKLAIFSLVIVFAISIDRLTTHYLTGYISDNIFTDTQEFFIRLSYPIVIFLVLWIAKSM